LLNYFFVLTLSPLRDDQQKKKIMKCYNQMKIILKLALNGLEQKYDQNKSMVLEIFELHQMYEDMGMSNLFTFNYQANLQYKSTRESLIEVNFILYN
jgi:hypothetical protein